MPIDAAEGLKVLGYDPAVFENIEAFRHQVESDWLKAGDAHTNDDVRKRVFGSVNGQLRTALKQSGKELELEAEWDKMDPLDGIRLIAQELGPKLKKMAKELKDAKEGVATAPEIADLQKKYDDALARAKELDGVVKAKEQEFEAYKGEVSKQETQRKLEARYAEVLKDLPLKDMSDFERRGFLAALRSSVVLGFDDDGNEVVTNEKGERIRDAKKAHEYVTADQAARQFAEASKMLKDESAPDKVRKTIPISGDVGRKDGQKNETPRPLRPLAVR